MGRPYFTTPGVPVDRVAALRKAFDATMKDPRFLADAEKIGAEVDPMTGAEVEALLAKIYKTDKNAVSMLQRAMPRVD
jgi:tripartite-type tricarboxylate transporter receptor subunit TctC